MSSNDVQYNKMANMPVEKLIISLSIPAVISMLVTNIYNLVDTAFVGQLGNSASGAVGVVFGFMSILQAIGFMFGQGGGSILSRKLGQKDSEGASKAASTAFFYAFFMSIIVALICFIFLDELIMALGSTETIAPYAKIYISFILATAPFVTTSFTMNNILRYEGKAKLGMVGLLAGAILNIGGDALFMFGLHMGIAGAGLSTALSQLISFAILASMFVRGKTQCKLRLPLAARNPYYVVELMLTGFPSMLRQGLNSITTIMLNTQAGIYGDAAIAAMSIVSRVSFFVFSVAVGIGQGFQPVSGFNYGAKKYARLRKAYAFTFIVSESLMTVLNVLVLLNTEAVVSLFRDDPEVIQIATRALRLQCYAMFLLPPCMVSEMLMQSTGQKLLASLLSGLRSGLFFIPCLLILASLRGLAGIQEAQPLAYVLSFFPTIFIVYRFFGRMPKEDEQLA